jgi:hypothetical protein
MNGFISIDTLLFTMYDNVPVTSRQGRLGIHGKIVSYEDV